MADGALSKEFGEKAPPPPVMEAEEYRLLLEKLVTEGEAFGKTEPVAAYFLTNIKLDQTDDNGNKIGESVIEVKPAYIVMDISILTNEYARKLTVQDIAVQYAKRNLGLKDINAPDFKGSFLWSAKKNAFEGDYKRRDGLNEYGKETNIWDPRPEAFRLTLQFNMAATIPVEWGTYEMRVGSTLAVRDKDIPALVEALQSIRRGEKTIQEALYKQNDEGQTVARFDIYGMEPTFRDLNYKPVELKPETVEVLNSFKNPPTPVPKTVQATRQMA